jgi:hypothetical protein
MATAGDRIERQLHRDRPDQFWVTRMTEHPTREGKVYCGVVLDTWSSSLGMAIDQRRPHGETIIHSDQGT